MEQEFVRWRENWDSWMLRKSISLCKPPCTPGVVLYDFQDYFALFHCCEQKDGHYPPQARHMYTHYLLTNAESLSHTVICRDSAGQLAGGDHWKPHLSTFPATFLPLFSSPRFFLGFHFSPPISPTVLTRTYWHLDFHLSSLLVIDFRLHYSVFVLAPCCERHLQRDR